jgi:cytochrome c1
MGKDVVSFLTWAAEPEMEERKLVCFLYYPSNKSNVKII